MDNKIEKIVEILETREAILVKHIDLDKANYNDVMNGRFMRGRVAVEEHWLEETQKMLKILTD